ncbi:MAG: ABC transporter substrate-binding protein [Limnochordia bacterium]
MRKKWFIFTLLLLTFVGLGTASAQRVVLADFSWESVQVHNRIAAFILEHGYGYQVDFQFGESLPGLLGLRRGDIDIAMEIWEDNLREVYDEALAKGEVIELGQNFPDAPQGWYVPTYVIEGDPERGIEPVAPDLRSVADLAKYPELFPDAEYRNRARFYNAPPGWVAQSINSAKLISYGLDELYVDFATGSDTSLAMAIYHAYQRGEPVVAYYWEPTWIMGALDMTLLEEPAFDENLWTQEAGYPCAYPAASVKIAVNADFAHRAPEVVDFLANYQTTLAHNNDFLAYMEEQKASAEDAAIYFLEEYPEVWQSWIPDEGIKNKVEAALLR